MDAEHGPSRNEVLTDVMVAGAGLAGLTLALSLARAGVSCTLVDPRLQARREDSRTTAIACGSRRLYESLHVWSRVAPKAQPIHRIRVTEAGTPTYLHFEDTDLGEGPVGHIVDNRDLAGALLDAAMEAGVQTRAAAVSSVERSSRCLSVGLAPGTTILTKLLVGADGRQSPVRAFAGIGTRERHYRQSAIVCTVGHQRDHEGTAIEWFRPSGPFAVLPMTGRRSAIVWTEPTEVAEALMNLPRRRFTEELALRFDQVFGTPRLRGQPSLFPLSLVLARQHVADRIALAGDAAHAIHPIAGQGFNLGLRGIARLSEQVAGQVRLGLDPGDPRMLARYARSRRLDVLTMVAATDGLNRLFTLRARPVRALRSAGLGIVQGMPRIKLGLMRHAMGIAPVLPLTRSAGEDRSNSAGY